MRIRNNPGWTNARSEAIRGSLRQLRAAGCVLAKGSELVAQVADLHVLELVHLPSRIVRLAVCIPSRDN